MAALSMSQLLEARPRSYYFGGPISDPLFPTFLVGLIPSALSLMRNPLLNCCMAHVEEVDRLMTEIFLDELSYPKYDALR